MSAKQNGRLLNYLETHDGITTLEASDLLRICRLSERIRELQKLRYQFSKVWETTSGGARVVRYRIKPAQMELQIAA